MPIDQPAFNIPSVFAGASLPVDGEACVSRLRERLQQWCGVHLGPDKEYLFAHRLRPLMQELDLDGCTALLRAAEHPGGRHIRDRIIDALTTHETLFFRDQSPFQALREHVIPAVKLSGRRQLKIWSTACSTGQEPYSIAICLLESIADIEQWNVSILATDVSPATIEIAKQGLYRDHEIRRGISCKQRERFFEREDSSWRIQKRIRNMVQYRVADLTATAQPVGPFDVVFCRNVLIYFRPEVAKAALRRVASRLSETGCLFLGSSELSHSCEDVLAMHKLGDATCYRRLPSDRLFG
jgi:chemotaxis protein methyltransferase CheR